MLVSAFLHCKATLQHRKLRSQNDRHSVSHNIFTNVQLYTSVSSPADAVKPALKYRLLFPPAYTHTPRLMGMNIFRCEARSLRSVGPCENKAAVCAGELHRPATLTHVLLIKRGTTVFNWWSASHMAIPWTTRSSTAHQLMQEQISGLQ